MERVFAHNVCLYYRMDPKNWEVNDFTGVCLLRLVHTRRGGFLPGAVL